MNNQADETNRVDVGFQSGQALALRMTESAYRELVEALRGEHGSAWHDVQSFDSVVTVDLRQVTYVRREVEAHRVGF